MFSNMILRLFLNCKKFNVFKMNFDVSRSVILIFTILFENFKILNVFKMNFDVSRSVILPF